MAQDLLKMKDVSKTFHAHTANENKVIKNINLTIKPEDFIAVIGGNGAGKSTLLNLIAGNLKLRKGQIFLEGQDISKQSDVERAVNIARVFQDPLKGTAPRMTVAENLAIALNRGNRRTFTRSLNSQTTSLFKNKLAQAGLGLENKLNQEVGSLSGGQRQVIALIMATLKQPKLLLLDEHVAALDPATSEKIMQLTQDIVTQQGITTLMITHNMTYALDYGNRLIMMDHGKIIVDLDSSEKEKLNEEDLMHLFKNGSDSFEMNDKMFLK